MKTTKSATISRYALVLGFSTCVGMTGMAGETQNTRVYDFDSEATRGTWRAVNDGVMGGVSRGAYDLTKDGHLHFHGKLSLENNGGFASIRSSGPRHNLKNYQGIILRVRGDGRSYYFTIRTDFRIMAGSYRMAFATTAGKWQEIYLPFEKFRATSFGRTLRYAPKLNRARIEGFGIMLADKKPGPFNLEVDWIGTATQKPRADEAAPTGKAKPSQAQREEASPS